MTTADMHVSIWRKSSYSGNNANCIEIGRAPDSVSIRDSKSRTTGTLELPGHAFSALLRTTK